jgi:hypothetical protein
MECVSQITLIYTVVTKPTHELIFTAYFLARDRRPGRDMFSNL